MINFFKGSFGNLYIFKKVDKTINDVPLKSLIFQTGQKKWDGGSNLCLINNTLFKKTIKFQFIVNTN